MLTINRYDEFGKPHAANAGRFQYTGQMWLGEPGLYHYKARAYAPHLGRFLQTDPIRYEGGVNLYTYVGNDPINWVDPLGLQGEDPPPPPDIVVTARRPDIVVTGHRKARTFCDENPWLCAPLGNPQVATLGGNPSHNYERTFRITKQNTQCTVEQAQEAVMDAAVPGRSENNVSGQTYEVSWFGSSLLTGPDPSDLGHKERIPSPT